MLFFILALVVAAAGFLLLPAGIPQIGSFAVATLFLILFVSWKVRKAGTRSWRAE